MGERKNKTNKVGKNIFGNSEVKNIGKKFVVEKFGKVKISSSYAVLHAARIVIHAPYLPSFLSKARG